MLTVLLVEDDPADQALTRRAAGEGAFELEIVGSGRQALDYLLRRGEFAAMPAAPRPELVLLDLNLDGESGFEVLEAIRSDEHLRTTVVIVLTTSAEEDDVRRSYALGAHSFVTKPTRLESWKECFRTLETYWLHFARLPHIEPEAGPR